MTYFLMAYFSGLVLMVLGLIAAESAEQRDVRLITSIVAYVFWPLTLLAVLGTAIIEKMQGPFLARRSEKVSRHHFQYHGHS